VLLHVSGLSRPRTPRTPLYDPESALWHPTFCSTQAEESGRESGALVDGLIIGHHLTRTHYEDRLAAQAETIDALRAGAAEHAYLSDNEVEDPDDLDAVGGYKAVGFAGGSSEAGSNELDEFEAAEDPWEDDTFGHDDY
jgi:hypothetical protein